MSKIARFNSRVIRRVVRITNALDSFRDKHSLFKMSGTPDEDREFAHFEYMCALQMLLLTVGGMILWMFGVIE